MTDIDKEFLENGAIMIDGDIDEELYSKVYKEITYLEKKGKEEIEIIIHSSGGSVSATMGICDVMKSCGTKIRTVATSKALSGGFLILIAGDERIITENTVLMCHNFIGYLVGSYGQLRSMQKEWDMLYNNCVNHILAHSKLKSKARVEKIVLKDICTYFTPEEALKYGFVDEVLKR